MSIINILKKAADNTKGNSPATKLRIKRFLIFKSLIALLPRPLSILDIGGTQIVLERMNFTEEPDVKIVLLNLFKVIYGVIKSVLIISITIGTPEITSICNMERSD